MELAGGAVSLVDTGGLHRQSLPEDKGGKNHYFNLTTSQSHRAIDEADLVLLVLDIRKGSSPFGSRDRPLSAIPKQRFLACTQQMRL